MAQVAQRLWRRIKTALPSPVRQRATVLVRSCLSRMDQWRRRSARYQFTHSRMTKQLTDQVVRSVHRQDEFFVAYAAAQISKSLDSTRGHMLGPLLMDRTERLVRLLDQALPVERGSLVVLCVGCRNTQELTHIARICRVGRVQGLDLFSDDPRIHVGDMHAMPFSAGSFDVVYACHSLEHAYDLRRALAECVRVAKPGGLLVIEMPVHFPLSATDHWDVGSSAILLTYLADAVTEVLLQDDAPETVRVIVRVVCATHHEPVAQPIGQTHGHDDCT